MNRQSGKGRLEGVLDTGEGTKECIWEKENMHREFDEKQMGVGNEKTKEVEGTLTLESNERCADKTKSIDGALISTEWMANGQPVCAEKVVACAERKKLFGVSDNQWLQNGILIPLASISPKVDGNTLTLGREEMDDSWDTSDEEKFKQVKCGLDSVAGPSGLVGEANGLGFGKQKPRQIADESCFKGLRNVETQDYGGPNEQRPIRIRRKPSYLMDYFQ